MNRFKNFFHGIYGIDGLSCGLLFLSLLINLLTTLIPAEGIQMLNPVSLLPLLLCLLRFFSHNHRKRQRENERFMRIMRPLFEYFDQKSEERAGTGFPLFQMPCLFSEDPGAQRKRQD